MIELDRDHLVDFISDEDLMIIGEDSCSGGPVEMRALEDHELPADFVALTA
ncbi:MAG TPA: hypothetical protein VNT31_04380 [Nocardioides sp.]|nr:hypothetical protein [Nocardioides sp.]